jgi:predicted ATPase
MISKITLKNFKCFREQTFELGKLNVFCGENGVGKSSTIQSLLITREANQCAEDNVFVRLNGLYNLDLGEVLDVFHTNPSSELIEFLLTIAGIQHSISASADRTKAENTFLNFDQFAPVNAKCFQSRKTGYFTYLSPEREGPRDLQRIQSVPSDHLQLGHGGEFSAEVLQANERVTVREALLHSKTDVSKEANKWFRVQLEQWMNDIFPNVEIKTVSSPGTNAIGLRLKKGGIEADWLKPTNIGFGISYCLPILLGGLMSKEGGILIVDSPEAHLHPKSQSQVAQFLAVVAKSGVQVLIETHSDHIINGVRLAVARDDITTKDVKIHFLAVGGSGAENLPITVTENGSLSKWPPGFFDQIEKDLAEIVKRKRAKK